MTTHPKGFDLLRTPDDGCSTDLSPITGGLDRATSVIQNESEAYRRPAWIVDIDGTLALNNSGRSPYDDSRVHEDDSCPIIKELVIMLSQTYDIVICSGRADSCRTQTQNWLFQHEIPYMNLFMRKAGDNRKDSIVKLEILDNLILPHWDVRGVLDDRNQVVEAWRSRGLKCLQVAPGDF